MMDAAECPAPIENNRWKSSWLNPTIPAKRQRVNCRPLSNMHTRSDSARGSATFRSPGTSPPASTWEHRETNVAKNAAVVPLRARVERADFCTPLVFQTGRCISTSRKTEMVMGPSVCRRPENDRFREESTANLNGAKIGG